MLHRNNDKIVFELSFCLHTCFFSLRHLPEDTSIPTFYKKPCLYPFYVAGGKETTSFKEHGTFKENYLNATMHGIHLQNANDAPSTSTLPINVQCSILLMYYKIFNSNKQWDFLRQEAVYTPVLGRCCHATCYVM